MNRLFIAIDLPSEIKEFISGALKSNFNDSKIKWEKNEKFHLTLKFLGDTSDEQIPNVVNLLGAIAGNYKKLNLEIVNSGVFKVNFQPRIIWLGLSQNKALTSLYYKLQSEFEKLNYKSDKRKFKPHITIARLKGFEKLPDVENLNSVIGTHKFTADSIKLYKSKLLPTGSVYTVLKEFELK